MVFWHSFYSLFIVRPFLPMVIPYRYVTFVPIPGIPLHLPVMSRLHSPMSLCLMRSFSRWYSPIHLFWYCCCCYLSLFSDDAIYPTFHSVTIHYSIHSPFFWCICWLTFGVVLFHCYIVDTGIDIRTIWWWFPIPTFDTCILFHSMIHSIPDSTLFWSFDIWPFVDRPFMPRWFDDRPTCRYYIDTFYSLLTGILHLRYIYSTVLFCDDISVDHSIRYRYHFDTHRVRWCSVPLVTFHCFPFYYDLLFRSRFDYDRFSYHLFLFIVLRWYILLFIVLLIHWWCSFPDSSIHSVFDDDIYIVLPFVVDDTHSIYIYIHLLMSVSFYTTHCCWYINLFHWRYLVFDDLFDEFDTFYSVLLFDSTWYILLTYHSLSVFVIRYSVRCWPFDYLRCRSPTLHCYSVFVLIPLFDVVYSDHSPDSISFVLFWWFYSVMEMTLLPSGGDHTIRLFHTVMMFDDDLLHFVTIYLIYSVLLMISLPHCCSCSTDYHLFYHLQFDVTDAVISRVIRYNSPPTFVLTDVDHSVFPIPTGPDIVIPHFGTFLHSFYSIHSFPDTFRWWPYIPQLFDDPIRAVFCSIPHWWPDDSLWYITICRWYIVCYSFWFIHTFWWYDTVFDTTYILPPVLHWFTIPLPIHWWPIRYHYILTDTIPIHSCSVIFPIDDEWYCCDRLMMTYSPIPFIDLPFIRCSTFDLPVMTFWYHSTVRYRYSWYIYHHFTLLHSRFVIRYATFTILTIHSHSSTRWAMPFVTYNSTADGDSCSRWWPRSPVFTTLFVLHLHIHSVRLPLLFVLPFYRFHYIDTRYSLLFCSTPACYIHSPHVLHYRPFVDVAYRCDVRLPIVTFSFVTLFPLRCSSAYSIRSRCSVLITVFWWFIWYVRICRCYTFPRCSIHSDSLLFTIYIFLRLFDTTFTFHLFTYILPYITFSDGYSIHYRSIPFTTTIHSSLLFRFTLQYCSMIIRFLFDVHVYHSFHSHTDRFTFHSVITTFITIRYIHFYHHLPHSTVRCHIHFRCCFHSLFILHCSILFLFCSIPTEFCCDELLFPFLIRLFYRFHIHSDSFVIRSVLVFVHSVLFYIPPHHLHSPFTWSHLLMTFFIVHSDLLHSIHSLFIHFLKKNYDAFYIRYIHSDHSLLSTMVLFTILMHSTLFISLHSTDFPYHSFIYSDTFDTWWYLFTHSFISTFIRCGDLFVHDLHLFYLIPTLIPRPIRLPFHCPRYGIRFIRYLMGIHSFRCSHYSDTDLRYIPMSWVMGTICWWWLIATLRYIWFWAVHLLTVWWYRYSLRAFYLPFPLSTCSTICSVIHSVIHSTIYISFVDLRWCSLIHSILFLLMFDVSFYHHHYILFSFPITTIQSSRHSLPFYDCSFSVRPCCCLFYTDDVLHCSFVRYVLMMMIPFLPDTLPFPYLHLNSFLFWYIHTCGTFHIRSILIHWYSICYSNSFIPIYILLLFWYSVDVRHSLFIYLFYDTFDYSDVFVHSCCYILIDDGNCGGISFTFCSILYHCCCSHSHSLFTFFTFWHSVVPHYHSTFDNFIRYIHSPVCSIGDVDTFIVRRCSTITMLFRKCWHFLVFHIGGDSTMMSRCWYHYWFVHRYGDTFVTLPFIPDDCSVTGADLRFHTFLPLPSTPHSWFVGDLFCSNIVTLFAMRSFHFRYTLHLLRYSFGDVHCCTGDDSPTCSHWWYSFPTGDGIVIITIPGIHSLLIFYLLLFWPILPFLFGDGIDRWSPLLLIFHSLFGTLLTIVDTLMFILTDVRFRWYHLHYGIRCIRLLFTVLIPTPCLRDILYHLLILHCSMLSDTCCCDTTLHYNPYLRPSSGGIVVQTIRPTISTFPTTYTGIPTVLIWPLTDTDSSLRYILHVVPHIAIPWPHLHCSVRCCSVHSIVHFIPFDHRWSIPIPICSMMVTLLRYVICSVVHSGIYNSFIPIRCSIFYHSFTPIVDVHSFDIVLLWWWSILVDTFLLLPVVDIHLLNSDVVTHYDTFGTPHHDFVVVILHSTITSWYDHILRYRFVVLTIDAVTFLPSLTDHYIVRYIVLICSLIWPDVSHILFLIPFRLFYRCDCSTCLLRYRFPFVRYILLFVTFILHFDSSVPLPSLYLFVLLLFIPHYNFPFWLFLQSLMLFPTIPFCWWYIPTICWSHTLFGPFTFYRYSFLFDALRAIPIHSSGIPLSIVHSPIPICLICCSDSILIVPDHLPYSCSLPLHLRRWYHSLIFYHSTVIHLLHWLYSVLSTFVVDLFPDTAITMFDTFTIDRWSFCCSFDTYIRHCLIVVIHIRFIPFLFDDVVVPHWFVVLVILMEIILVTGVLWYNCCSIGIRLKRYITTF